MSNASGNSFDINGKAELKKAFKSAKSVDETLKAFKDMEACFEEAELGLECFRVADKLLREGHDREQVLCFGKRALRILLDNHGSSLLITCVCHLLGSVCLNLEKYDESLSYLNRANMNLSKLEEEDNSPSSGNRVLHNLLDVQLKLSRVKEAMGKREEVVVHERRILEIKEKMMEEGCIKLGEANQDVYKAYFEALDLEGALPFCLKALEIYTNHLGRDSMEVAQVMRHLALIYYKSGEYEKAFEQNQLSQSVMKNTTPDSPDLLKAETEAGNMLIDLGRYEEAVDVLKGVVSHTDIEENERVKLLVTMARALCYLEKFADAKKYMRAAQSMLEKKEMDPMLVAIGFADMSVLYEKMNDFETAISLIKGVLALPELLQKLLPQFSSKLFSLISLSGKEKEGIPYMEGVVEKLRESFGPGHFQVGYGYANLGVAYCKSGQQELAAKSLANAKDVLDVSLGPCHLTSLKISHALSVTYAGLGRYHQALEIEEKVVEGLKGLEPSELEFLYEVVKQVSKMKERVAAPPSKDDEDLSAKISKCGISDDGKVL